MPDSDSPWIANVRGKTERAKHHLKNLQIEARTFLDSKPYAIAVKKHPKTSELVHYVDRIKSIPPDIGLIAGDVIHNLRSALDHLVWQLVKANGNEPIDGPGGTGFPIFQKKPQVVRKATGKKSKSGAWGKIEGVSRLAKKLIRATKPYKRGNRLLWALDQLDNIDKHRRLIVGGLIFNSLGIWSVLAEDFIEYPVEGHRRPLKVGDPLVFDSSGLQNQEDMKLTFDIALHEPKVLKSQPLLETLQELVHLVDGIIDPFIPLL